jgi:AraC family transcriptional regulator
MAASTDALPALSRIEADGVLRALAAGEHAALAGAWGDVRVLQIRTEPQDVPEGYLLHHVVTLNLGSEAVCDANFEGRGWQTHRTPHHGVGVYPAFVRYASREHDAREYLIAEIAPDLVTGALGSPAATAELRPVIGARDAFAEHVLLALAEEARAGAPSGAIRAGNLGTALLTHLLELDLGRRPAHVAALPSPKLRRVLDYVSAHLDAPLTLRQLAELVEMDVFRFVRAFKQSTGISPHRYVLQARIARAKELLRNRGLSITEIALRTGFATPSHFSVTFRRIANATPRAYRDSVP